MPKKIFFILIYLGISFFLLFLPYGKVYGQEESFIDFMQPRDVNNGFDPLFTFCLYAPALMAIEGLFLRLPLRGWQLALMIVQLIGVIWTWPIVALVPIGLFGGREPYWWTTGFIDIYATYALLVSILVLIPGTSRLKWIRVQFSRT